MPNGENERFARQKMPFGWVFVARRFAWFLTCMTFMLMVILQISGPYRFSFSGKILF